MGNERGNSWNILVAPADAEGVISVAAVSPTGAAAPFSSVGPTADGRLKPDVAAQGTSIQTARSDFARGGPEYFGGQVGTSFSTPLVAGAAALYLQAHPDATPADVKAALHATASQSDAPDTCVGYGIVRARDAVHASAPLAADCAFVPLGEIRALRIAAPTGGVFAPAKADLGWRFDLPAAGRVSARVFDVTGRLVATLLDEDRAAGADLPLAWNGRNASGDDTPSGAYVVRLESPSGVAAARLILVR
jgi:subtilisin family serine protease